VPDELRCRSVAANELLEVIATFPNVVKERSQAHDPSQSMEGIGG
jgi:hypothetical protein